MEINKNNDYSELARSKCLYADPKPVPNPGPPSVFSNWISSYQHRPVLQPPPLTTQHRHQPIGQQPFPQVPQFFERAHNSHQQPYPYNCLPYQHYRPPAYQVASQQPYCVPFQQVYRQQGYGGYPLQQQPYVLYV